MQSIGGVSLGTTASATITAPAVDPLEKATQEFEAMFLGYLLKVMRSTVETSEEDTFAKGKDIYMDMFDNELALNIARTRSLGVGAMMYRQLKENEAGAKSQTIDIKRLNDVDGLKVDDPKISGKVPGETHDN